MSLWERVAPKVTMIILSLIGLFVVILFFAKVGDGCIAKHLGGW